MKKTFTMIRFLACLITFLVFLSPSDSVAQTTVTIGATGTSSSATRGPFQRSSSGSSSVYSRAYLVYTASELATAGIAPGATISQINWDLGSTNTITATGDATMEVLLKNSSATEATDTSWTDVTAGATSVGFYTFNLANNFPGAEGWMDFAIAPFVYTGGTLEITVEWDCSNLVPADPSQPNLLFTGNGSLNWHWGETDHISLANRAGSSGPSSTLTVNFSNGLPLKQRVNTQLVYTPAPVLGVSLFLEDFDGSNTTNTPTFSEECFDTGSMTDYFGIVCQSGTGCTNEIPVGFEFTNAMGQYFGARDMDADPCSASLTKTMDIAGIDISSCCDVLYVSFDVAESRNMGDENGLEWGTSNMREDTWDGNSNVTIKASIDGGPFETVTTIEAFDGSDTRPGIDVNCDGKADGAGEPELTDTFTKYSFELPTGGTTLDLQVEVNELNTQGEDIAIDNIEVSCSAGAAGGFTLPACTPYVSNLAFFLEDFDGSNTTNPFAFPCVIQDSKDYFGIVCLPGGPCGNADINTVFTGAYLGTQGSFFGARDMDPDATLTPCPTPDPQTSTSTGIDISSCSGTSTMYLCFDIAESDVTAEEGTDTWDGNQSNPNSNSFVIFSAVVDGGTSFDITSFAAVANNNTGPALDLNCDGNGNGTSVTNTFTTFCFELPILGNSLDLSFTVGGMNTNGDDVAIDNIALFCSDNETCLPAPLSVSCTTACPDSEDPMFTTACPADVTIECSDPLPAEETLTATDDCGFVANVVFINEVHYDNTGGDIGEFIEVAGSAGVDLAGYQLITYNGSNSMTYNAPMNLSGIIPDEGAGAGAIAFTYPSNGLQNGSPDGAALVDPNGNVLSFISYEGTITANGGPADGMTSVNIGTEPSSTAVGESLQLTGTGDPSSLTWTGPLAESPGLLNAGEVLNLSTQTISVSPVSSFVAGTCANTGVLTRTYTATDAAGKTTTCTQTITIEDNVGPSFAETLPANITVSCDDIPAAATLTAIDNCSSATPWINEFHYDNTGADMGEFIEVAGFEGTDLSGYSLELYNGSNGTVYNTTSLSGLIPNEGANFGAIAFSIAGIQNGSPDGFALVAPGGVVVEFLSYEGSLTASNGAASGMTSTDVGVAQAGSNPVMLSLQLMGSGSQASDFTWSNPSQESPNTLNNGQSIAGNLPVIFEENTVAGSCSEESTITRTWTTSDDCGNPASHTQIITVQDITAPAAACQNITVQLDENGQVEILPTEINNTSGSSTTTSVMVGNTINQLSDVLKSNAGFCPTPAVSTNTCDCPTGFVAVGYSGITGNSYGGNVLSQFSLHCKEVMPNGDLGTAVTVTCSNGTLTTGTDSGPLLATGNDVLVGAQINIGCAIDGITGFSKPISEILAVDPSTNSSAIAVLGGMGGSAQPAMYVPAGSVIVGMETFEDPSPPNGTSLIGVTGGVAWRYASLSEVTGLTQDNCAAQSSLTYTLSQSLFTCDDLGENVVTLSVTDPCGNTGTCTAIVTVEDNIAPVITCPDNIYVHLDPGACDAIVTWNPATAVDNCTVVEINQTGGPVSGTTFDRNTTTTVSYEAIDQSGNVSTCSFTIEIIEFVPASNDITCNSLVNISLDENCEATVGADQILEGNNYGCYDDYIVTFADTGLPVVLDGSHIGQTFEVMVTNPNGVPCWGNIFVEDKLIPDLVCSNDVTVRCDDDTEPGSPFVATSDMVAPTMSVDNATISETVTFGSGNGSVVDVDVTVESDHSWVGDLVISITSPAGTTVELMNNIGGPGFGCAGDGLDLIFDDAATLTYADLDGTCNNNPAAEGTFQPLDALSVFNGQTAAGDWTISVTDLATGDSGDVDVTINLSANSEIPFPVPATATVTPTADPFTFNVAGFDPCGNTVLTYSDVESGELCSGDAQIERTWTATDESGNTTSCTEIISIVPTTLADVAASLPTDITVNYDANCNLNIPALLSDVGCENIGIGLDGEPTIIDICEGSYKMLRKYVLVDWCTNETLEHLQIVKILDTEGPSLTCPADLTISTNSSNCEGGVILPYPSASDCGTATANIDLVPTSASGVIVYNNAQQVWIISELIPGAHTVTWTAIDDCGNESACDFTITTEDQIAPIAICDEHTILGIGSDGTASIDAITFDDGSYDNCGIVEMTARRMDNPACPGFDATPFAASVPFYCCDVNTTVMVEFRVRDAAGNTNSCMVEVEVQDKINPTVICPSDKDVECSETYLDYIIVGQPLPQDAVDANGEAVASDNCSGVTLTNNVIANTVDCGTGTITIVWTATDAVGRTSSCIQRYFVENNSPFYIVDTEARNYNPHNSTLIPNPGTYPYPSSGLPTLVGVGPHSTQDGVEWPADYEGTSCGTGLEPNDLPSPYNAPIIFEGACNNIAVGHHDQVLDFGAGDACLKILRKWYVVDWCQANANQDPTEIGPGVWHYTQIIKIVNSNDPNVTVVDFPSVVDNYDADCGSVFAAFEITADDDCTSQADLQVSWEFSTGLSGTGLSASGSFANGSYSLTFTVSDGCNNTVWETHDFTVVDAKKPTPVCIFGISTTVMPSSGAVTIWASDFESGSSYDNCTSYDDLHFSFSQDINDIYLDITCADIANDPLFPVTLYVTDGAGNFDFCSTFVNVQDPNGACAGPTATPITGTIENENQEVIEEVIVTLSNAGGSMGAVVTGSNGTYTFNNGNTGASYDVTPGKDINYLNGVTTYDLVLISKHILGTEVLDSPYKMIAADANNTQSITTLDIVKLRALILHIDDELANNTSWRFVDANHVFGTNVFDFPEYVSPTVNGSVFNPANFMAVKVGDVNGTASPNSLLGSDTRTFAGELALSLEATQVAAGEEFTVDFKANDFKNIAGYQFTLGFDNSAVEFVDVTSNLAGLDVANFGLTKLSEGVITTSWNSNEGVTVANGEALFSMTFRATAAVNTKELLSINSRYTESEAYSNSDLYNVVLEFNGATVSNGFELFQNTPNPFKAETTIGFNMPAAGAVTLTIYDVSGRTLRLIEMDAVKGANSVNVSREGIDATGVLYYQLETATETATKKMILVD